MLFPMLSSLRLAFAAPWWDTKAYFVADGEFAYELNGEKAFWEMLEFGEYPPLVIALRLPVDR